VGVCRGLGERQDTSGILRGVATRRDVERTLRGLLKRFDGAKLDGASLPDADRTIACVITDLGVVYRAEYGKGRIDGLHLSEDGDDDADVRISLSSDELIALSEGRSSLAIALLMGRIRVDAGARDLLLLRQLF
jgi:hypothetical protein